LPAEVVVDLGEVSCVVQSGDPHTVHGGLDVLTRGGLQQDDVGDLLQPPQQRLVGRADGVVVAADEDVGHPQFLDGLEDA
jgi:hypothetical protein